MTFEFRSKRHCFEYFDILHNLIAIHKVLYDNGLVYSHGFQRAFNGNFVTIVLFCLIFVIHITVEFRVCSWAWFIQMTAFEGHSVQLQHLIDEKHSIFPFVELHKSITPTYVSPPPPAVHDSANLIFIILRHFFKRQKAHMGLLHFSKARNVIELTPETQELQLAL